MQNRPNDRAYRQSVLRDGYYFTCECERCNREENDDPICREIVNVKFKSLCSIGLPPFDDVPHADWKAYCMQRMKLLPLYEKVYGEFHPNFTLELMTCLRVQYSRIGTVYGLESFLTLGRKISRTIEVSHGKNHPLWKEFRRCFEDEEWAMLEDPSIVANRD